MKNKKPENPPAFPFTWVSQDGPCAESGMSLRDFFAAKAMGGIMAMDNKDIEAPSIDEAYAVIAKNAYKIADAMLLERSK